MAGISLLSDKISCEIQTNLYNNLDDPPHVFLQQNGRSSNQLQNRERSSKQHPSDTKLGEKEKPKQQNMTVSSKI